MKFLNSIISGVIALAITSCVSLPTPKFSLQNKNIFKLRFQNMLALELYSAGCSILSYGGVEKMCEFALQNPADLVFQIGPSFSTVFFEKSTRDELQSRRTALWKVWEVQKVGFYSVDALDLQPSLADFKEAYANRSILLLSSNLKTKDLSQYLFTPYLKLDINGTKVGILAFSENSNRLQEKEWNIESIDLSFQKIGQELTADVDLFYVLGSISKSAREEIVLRSQRPVLFLGGELSERNTTHIMAENAKYFFAKTPDLGRGFGEITVGHFEKDLLGKTEQQVIGGMDHSFRASLLDAIPTTSNRCSQILKTEEPQSLTTEALKP